MKIVIIAVGKTAAPYISEAVEAYMLRLKHYISVEWRLVATGKSNCALSENDLRKQEGEAILKALKPDDFVVLLDDKGKEYTSLTFSKWVGKLQERHRQTVFVIGGAYGFSREVYSRANSMMSLSRMTFSHQIVRIVLSEQLYRAMTILKHEPYHHETTLFFEK
ncbi:MAG: 23S rRNA (pseudouridine(1915)-N(3))-methyltransferase RlmH [Prevotellaceae bacterium]|jgi:23S rRNA (pseudouridine1915-N3)-methyltransferase|nr:23S rRNA (pseudouridine(1915)-N(3))-methyltransferase RlmH [Prevotellaceae bacterium]